MHTTSKALKQSQSKNSILFKAFILAALGICAATISANTIAQSTKNFAQTSGSSSAVPKNHLLSGFIYGCNHSKDFLKLEEKLCKQAVDKATKITKCNIGEAALPKDIDALLINWGKDAVPNKKFAYKDQIDFAQYQLRFKPDSLMLGPLAVESMNISLGHSNGIRAAELFFSNVNSAEQAQKMLNQASIKIEASSDEILGDVIPKFNTIKDKTTKSTKVTLFCDLSN